MVTKVVEKQTPKKLTLGELRKTVAKSNTKLIKKGEPVPKLDIQGLRKAISELTGKGINPKTGELQSPVYSCAWCHRGCSGEFMVNGNAYCLKHLQYAGQK